MSQVLALREEVVPQAYREENWTKFLSACLIYDPPDTKLLEFAAYDDPVDTTGNLATSAADSTTNRSSNTSVLPIERIPDPARLRDDTLWYYRTAIDEIGKRFLEPLGRDIWKMFNTVTGPPLGGEKEGRWLSGEYHERVEDNKPRPYIFVEEITSRKDVEEAFRLIKASERYPTREGRPRRDRLVALQCAVFHDHHGWTYEQVASHFGWVDHTLVSKYLRDGRRLLEP